MGFINKVPIFSFDLYFFNGCLTYIPPYNLPITASSAAASIDGKECSIAIIQVLLKILAISYWRTHMKTFLV
jgi:hypothetical protein